MITRSKVGTFKPKLYHVDASPDSSIPSTIYEALSSPHWRDAAVAEFTALQQNNTWTLVPLPEGRTPVGCKWIFKVKQHSDGIVARFKARLVAKGFSQVPGRDFMETFSPVVKFTTVNVVLSIAISNGWALRHVDINNAFLHGDLEEEVFMEQPPGFEIHSEDGIKLVCKLTKAIYGLKQAPRNWYAKIRDCLHTIGFRSSGADSSLFSLHEMDVVVYILLYVDDIIITSSSDTQTAEVVQLLSKQFSLKDLGSLSYFLGIEVHRSKEGLFLSQRKYIIELLAKAKMEEANITSTPMLVSEKLAQNSGSPLADAQAYQSIVGSLLYLCHTRPDITYNVHRAAQYMHNPCEKHLAAMKRILRYISGTLNHGLLLPPSEPNASLIAFADADWGSSLDDRRSTSSNCIYLGNSLLSWSCKKQKVVARSTMEAEYRSIAETASELTWLCTLLSDMGVSHKNPPIIWSDSSSAVALSTNPVFHAQSKHVDLDIHFVREKISDKKLQVNFVPALFQTADGFTKALSSPLFTLFRQRLNVTNLDEIQQQQEEKNRGNVDV